MRTFGSLLELGIFALVVGCSGGGGGSADGGGGGGGGGSGQENAPAVCTATIITTASATATGTSTSTGFCNLARSCCKKPETRVSETTLLCDEINQVGTTESQCLADLEILQQLGYCTTSGGSQTGATVALTSTYTYTATSCSVGVGGAPGSCSYPTCMANLVTCEPSGECAKQRDPTAFAYNYCFANGVRITAEVDPDSMSMVLTVKNGSTPCYQVADGTSGSLITYTFKDAFGQTIATGWRDSAESTTIICTAGPPVVIGSSCSTGPMSLGSKVLSCPDGTCTP